ncbi:unnamed protein product [Meganyctiphanes norvegica]|uniref:Uncharacterized protein n=1 Tax=Meganyctiphanes norvegica TaxID=48144 RepID=A0AAV2RJ81_MEGNR
MSVLHKIIKMKVVLAILVLVATASAAPWGVLNAGVLPYSGFFPNNAGVLPYAAAPAVAKVTNIDGGWPYTDVEGMSTGLTNVGARVPLTYGAYSPYHVATTW